MKTKTDQRNRIEALASHLGIDADSIESSGDNEYVVDSRPTKRGTSPAEAKGKVALLREALGKITAERDAQKWNRDDINRFGYNKISAWLREDCPEMLERGIHDVLNTLYFVSRDTDNEAHAVAHRDTIREAFDGVEIQDRRTDEQTDSGTYLVLTDAEADERTAEYIADSLWAFNSDFLAGETELPAEAFAALSEKCESGNDGIRKMVEATCGLKHFCADAAAADGRGHFLASYDNEEHEAGEYYIYRTN